MNDTDAIRRLMLAVERLERAADDQTEQARLAYEELQRAQAAQSALAAARDADEAAWRQTMHRLFEDQQHRTGLALRPAVLRAWRGLIASTAGIALLALALLLLLEHEYARLQDARAKADAAEVSAQVQAALRHVQISSCGGRPCVRLDRDTPTWTGGDGEYVLVDGSGR